MAEEESLHNDVDMTTEKKKQQHYSHAEECVQEAFITRNDRRRPIWDTPNKDDPIIQCTGSLKIEYDCKDLELSNGQITMVGTGTVISIRSMKSKSGNTQHKCYVLTAAHNCCQILRQCPSQKCKKTTIYRKCTSCQKATKEVQPRILIKPTNIYFTRRCTANRLQINNSLYQFGDTIRMSPINQNEIYFRESLYKLYPSPKEGYDVAIMVFDCREEEVEIYTLNCSKISLKCDRTLGGDQLFIYGYPGDKKDTDTGQYQMYGMSLPVKTNVKSESKDDEKKIEMKSDDDNSDFICINKLEILQKLPVLFEQEIEKLACLNNDEVKRLRDGLENEINNDIDTFLQQYLVKAYKVEIKADNCIGSAMIKFKKDANNDDHLYVECLVKVFSNEFEINKDDKTNKYHIVNSQIDTTSGQSGSCIWSLGGVNKKSCIVYGVHTGGSAINEQRKRYFGVNYGTFLDEYHLDWIEQIIQGKVDETMTTGKIKDLDLKRNRSYKANEHLVKCLAKMFEQTVKSSKMKLIGDFPKTIDDDYKKLDILQFIQRYAEIQYMVENQSQREIGCVTMKLKTVSHEPDAKISVLCFCLTKSYSQHDNVDTIKELLLKELANINI